MGPPVSTGGSFFGKKIFGSYMSASLHLQYLKQFNHEHSRTIEAWRQEQALERTQQRRPDILDQ